MNEGPLLSYEPSALTFEVELNKQLSSSLRLSNNTANTVIYKLLTTSPKKYGVRPRIGVLQPGSVCDIRVTTRPIKETFPNMKCKDKFMIRSAVTNSNATSEDARNMFREARDDFQERQLRVVYNMPSPSFESSEIDHSFSEVTRHSNEPTDNACHNTEPNENACHNTEPNDNDFHDTEPNDNAGQDTEPNDNACHDTEPNGNAVVRMSQTKLLEVQPTEIKVPLTSRKDASCLLQLSNVTEDRVAFRVTTLSSKYLIQPHIGILSPKSTEDISVKIQVDIPNGMQSEDTFLIQSMVYAASLTGEDIQDTFDQGTSPIEECKLQVVSIPQQENNTAKDDDLILRGIIIGLLLLLFCYIMKQFFSLLWSLTMLGLMLMIKIVKQLVSDSVEDWVVKTLISLVMSIWGRRQVL